MFGIAGGGLRVARCVLRVARCVLRVAGCGLTVSLVQLVFGIPSGLVIETATERVGESAKSKALLCFEVELAVAPGFRQEINGYSSLAFALSFELSALSGYELRVAGCGEPGLTGFIG